MMIRSLLRGLALPVSTLLLGCAGQLPLPITRPIIVYTGERLQADPVQMAEVEGWLRPQLDHIDQSRDFLIRLVDQELPSYPWESLEITADTAQVALWPAAPDAETPYILYAHYRLIEARGALDRWAPEAQGLAGLEAEEAILNRISDVWLLGRTVFDTQPFGPMDELLWAKESGYLRDFIFATQPGRFDEEEANWRGANPEREEEFAEWFERVFERRGPGFMAITPDDTPEPNSVSEP